MDLNTVNAIIKMIDTRIDGLNELLKTADSVQWTAQVVILTSLSDHLGNCMDSELSALENSTEQ
jgi:hypothetical protein